MPSTFETDADRLDILTELGEAVTYTPSGGAAVSGLYAIIDREAEVEEIVDGGRVIGIKPVASMRTTDLTGTVRNGSIEDGDGTTYTITAVLDDGEGMTKLVLKEA